MRLRLVHVLLALGAVIAVWLAVDWYWGAERQIERRLSRLQRLVAKTPAESDLSSLQAARAISEMFADPFELVAEPENYSTADRQTLTSGIYQYRSRSSTLVMEISALQIFIDEQGSGGNAYFTARFLTDLGDLRSAEQYDVRMHWVEIDGTWLIDHVQVASS